MGQAQASLGVSEGGKEVSLKSPATRGAGTASSIIGAQEGDA